MKKTIILKDSKGNILKKGEINSRNLEHFNTQLMYRSTVKISKKVYNRVRDKKVSYEY